jgi:hypothetical protein
MKATEVGAGQQIAGRSCRGTTLKVGDEGEGGGEGGRNRVTTGFGVVAVRFYESRLPVFRCFRDRY